MADSPSFGSRFMDGLAQIRVIFAWCGMLALLLSLVALAVLHQYVPSEEVKEPAARFTLEQMVMGLMMGLSAGLVSFALVLLSLKGTKRGPGLTIDGR